VRDVYLYLSIYLRLWTCKTNGVVWCMLVCQVSLLKNL
jgi:hypothetical protein